MAYLGVGFMEVNFLSAFVFSFFATAAFGILFQAPKKSLVISGVIGAVGWVLFVLLRHHLGYNSFHANFFAAVIIALGSDLSARIFKQPATIFVIPGIIPLVPGLGMYQGMTQIIEKNYELGTATLLTACTDSAAIALGMMVMTSVFRVLKMSKARKQRLQRLKGVCSKK